MNIQSNCTLCGQETKPITAANAHMIVCGSCTAIAKEIDLRKFPPDQQILNAIKSHGSNGISHENMLITPPFSMFAKWQMLDFFLELLIVQDQIRAVNYLTSGTHYFAKGF